MLTAQTQRAVEAALEVQDIDRAGALSEQALGVGEVHPLLFLFAGVRRQFGGDARGALALLAEAVRLAPDDPQILVSHGDALRHVGDVAAATATFDRALAIDPMQVAAWYGRAQALDAAGHTAAALDSFVRVTQLAPRTAPGHAGKASVLAQLGRTVEARAAAEHALSIDRDNPAAQIALARSDMADQHAAAAVPRLEALSERPDLPPADRIVALTLLGDAFDSLSDSDTPANAPGNTNAAFAAYAAAKARFAEIHAGPNAPPAHRLRVEAVDAALLALPPKPAAAVAMPETAGPATHIFLLGYPRSGTTLAEMLLASAPRVVTLEEAPTLAAADAYWSADGLAALAGLDEAALAALRRDYWQSVDAAGIMPQGQTFVDMDPFKAPQLPIIAALFPAAKIVVLRRDPRDVVWSCFRRSFVHTPATYEFTSLQRTARHYHAVMELTERSLDRLPITAHVLRYEDMIATFEATARALYDFVGLPWSDTALRFDETARSLPIKTRSAAQVRGGMFDGRGSWRRYARQLEPVLPILEPWVVKFGYAV